MDLTHLIFDLDNTLYPATLGIVERVDVLITRFMVERLGMSETTAETVRAEYRERHGTTLNGLMLHHRVQPDEFLAHVHALDLDELLQPAPALRAMLEALPYERVVFTNASAAHAERVLARLGVRTCFHDVFSLERLAYVPKPLRHAFAAVLAELGATPGRCLVIDDRLDNLHTAGSLGMRTMLVGAPSVPPEARIDLAVRSVLELPEALAAALP